MWQRFTERARKVVFYAQEEAGRLGENYVSTEHLLLGLVRENDSVAAKILDMLGVSLGRIRSEVERQVTRGDSRPGQDMQLTPRAKRVLDLAYDESRQLNNTHIGTEHLLLGLVREGEGLAGRVLEKLGVTIEHTRAEVSRLQEGNDPAMRSTIHDRLSQELKLAIDTATVSALRTADIHLVADHAVLAVLKAGPNTATQLLEDAGIVVDKYADALDQAISQVKPAKAGEDEIRYSMESLLLSAFSFARRFGYTKIQFDHVLLAALSHPSRQHAPIMAGLGLTLEKAVNVVQQAPGHTPAQPHDDIAAAGRELTATTRMRIDQSAVTVLSWATTEARYHGVREITDGDILIGLIRSADSAASQMLTEYGLNVDLVRSRLRNEDIDIEPDPDVSDPSSSPPNVAAKRFSPGARRALLDAHAEADAEGESTTQTHHLLLAMVKQKSGKTAQFLQMLGLDSDVVRKGLDDMDDWTPYDE